MIKIPKFFSLSPVDKLTGNRFNILTSTVHRDPMTGASYVQGRPGNIMMDKVGKPYIYQGASGWESIMKAAVEEGKILDDTEMALLYQMDPAIRAGWESSGKLGEILRRTGERRANQYTSMMAQKSFAGVSTAHAMALNLVAGEHLPMAEQGVVSRVAAGWIQNVALKMKSEGKAGVRETLTQYGKFTRAMSRVRTRDDVFAQIIRSSIAEPGREVTADPTAFIDAIIKIPGSKRAGAFPDAGLPRELLTRTTNFMQSEELFQQLIAQVDNPEIGNTMKDAWRTSGLGALLKSMNAPQSPVDMVREPIGGYFRRKPLIGALTKPSRVENTILAGAIGAENTALVKYGLAGAASLGALYLAFNFFRPNQSSTLGEMQGMGGEFWSPRRGRRMELPSRVPVDTPEYTWRAPPWDRRTRVSTYNPVTADKIAKFPGLLQDALSPVVHWRVAPSRDVRYNKYDGGFTLDDAIRSSQVILR